MDAKEKRKRVMTRSMKLGHCVCNPHQPCPCPVFKEKNICNCAGERVPLETGKKQVKLTDYVRSAGCASKISQKDLRSVLGMLPKVEDPRILVGMSTADDAGVFDLSDDTTIVQTVDVFTPGVDDPYTFGRIAGCNSLSDVYAMGGKPITALSIIGFPIYSLPHDVMADIIRGGMDVLKEAGCILLGGHSINDEEIKFGFAVTGMIKKKDVVSNAGAKPGDALILTKPLGTGIISLAGQIGKASKEALDACAKSMSTLNRIAAEIMVEHKATACTDVTGFGFIGHLANIARESGVTAEVYADILPLLPGVMEYAKAGCYSGANERNSEYSSELTSFEGTISEEIKAVLFDAQTSGGLLIALPEDQAEKALKKLHDSGITAASIVGQITEKSSGKIIVKPTAGKATVIKHLKEDVMTKQAKTDSCCGGHSEASGSTDNAMQMFKDFIGTTLKPGAVDVVTKELIAVALSLAVGCVPCTKSHIKKSLEMGISKAELEEAAAIAVAFGGCKTMMLWMDAKKELM